MRLVPLTFIALVLSIGATADASIAGSEPETCNALTQFSDGRLDASGALSLCLDRTPANGTVSLPAGTYRLTHPLVIRRSLTINTIGSTPNSLPCHTGVGNCAVLLIDPINLALENMMPVQIEADNVKFDRIAIAGASIRGKGRICRIPNARPNAGGIRVSAVSGFSITRSVLRDFACYTALEILTGAHDFVIESNTIGPNGNHRPGEEWADGLTVHEAARAKITRNRFIDNTDVQLILGGCRNCVIEGNRFEHTGPFSSASFAELMIHSWPSTSGDFTGTVVRNNTIDCGATRLCGFGILVGAEPWYSGRAFGGLVTDNTVKNARIGLNVDGLTGPMEFRRNKVVNSGGTFDSDCGRRTWPPTNVAPKSKRFVRGLQASEKLGAISTKGCILARKPL